jgi:hypothetical protein
MRVEKHILEQQLLAKVLATALIQLQLKEDGAEGYRALSALDLPPYIRFLLLLMTKDRS